MLVSPSQIGVIAIAVIYFINLILMVSVMYLERKDSLSALCWCLAFLFLPILSWIIYALVGKGPKFNRRKWSRRKMVADRLVESEFLSGHLQHFSSPEQDVAGLIALNVSNGAPCTVHNSIKIFTSAHEMYDEQLADMERAHSSIHVMYYLFKPDDAGRRFLEVMTRKAQEGLSVILVFDDSANPKTNKHFLRDFIRAGGKVEPFFPSKMTFFNHNFAYRNHRKVVVIDGLVGYIGGMNIGVDYLSLDKKITPWRDTMIKIEGEAVALLQTRFLQDFSCSGKYGLRNKQLEDLVKNKRFLFPEPLPTGEAPIQILSSGPDSPIEEIKLAFLKIIALTRRELYLETPYFIPDKSFIDALIIAKKSGVKVNLVIPGVPDKRTVYHVTLSSLEELLLAGISVYLYPGFIHAKMIVSDDRITSIGTANLDVRSFALNFEVTALVYDRSTVEAARTIALNDIAVSEELTLENYRRRSVKDKLAEGFLRLFSPLM